MKNIKQLFQYLSYLQYPLMLVGLYYAYAPLLYDLDLLWPSLNNALVFSGLAISFSSLQDTTKTQNKLSKRVWENPKYAKSFLIYMIALILFILLFGLFGFLISENEIIQEVSFGTIVLGIGLIGMLKVAIEMAEYHSGQEM